MLGARKGLHTTDFARLEAEVGGRAGSYLLGVGITPAAPRDERSADDQQRRRILGNHLERGHRASRHQIERPESVRPRLGAGVHDSGVRELAHSDRTLEERAFPGDALDERHAHPGLRDRQWKTGDASPGTEVGQRLGRADLGELQRDQRVREVVVDHLSRISDGCWGERILSKEAMEQPQAPLGVALKAVAGRERRQARIDVVACGASRHDVSPTYEGGLARARYTPSSGRT